MGIQLLLLLLLFSCSMHTIGRFQVDGFVEILVS